MATSADVVVRDVDFGSSETGVLRARIYKPDGPGPHPALVSIHGGGWSAGSRLDNEMTDRQLSAHGIVVMAADFRAPPVVRFPTPVADINLAIRWFKANATSYGADPARVGGLGFSSGGHQLALNALLPADERWAGHVSTEAFAVNADLSFLVLVYAVLDPVSRYRMARENGRQDLLDGHHAYWPDEATMRVGSPQFIVSSGLASRLPPALIVQGETDANLPWETADAFQAAYRGAGGCAEVLRPANAPHAFLRTAATSPAARSTISAIVRFVVDGANC